MYDNPNGAISLNRQYLAIICNISLNVDLAEITKKGAPLNRRALFLRQKEVKMERNVNREVNKQFRPAAKPTAKRLAEVDAGKQVEQSYLLVLDTYRGLLDLCACRSEILAGWLTPSITRLETAGEYLREVLYTVGYWL